MDEVQAAAALSTRRGRRRTELEAARILSGARRGGARRTPIIATRPTSWSRVPVFVRIEDRTSRTERRADPVGV